MLFKHLVNLVQMFVCLDNRQRVVGVITFDVSQSSVCCIDARLEFVNALCQRVYTLSGHTLSIDIC
ncbi:putative cell wall hydrolase [Cronobacter phage vB_CsaP_Ss1]|nr:putative cell wall hydrolase [Cronobacter phage vB_CsaP_Ss1]